jgi:nucleoside-diphosphate-sugar epimerase
MKHHRQGIINWFVRQAIEGKEIPIYGDGKQLRDTNYVDDVVNALLLAGVNEAANGRAFNLGGEPTSVLELARMITQMAGGGYRLIPFPDSMKAIEIGDYVADRSRAQSVLGWSPTVGLKDGLKRTIDYYCAERAHYW